jgi:WD40 repeat protein
MMNWGFRMAFLGWVCVGVASAQNAPPTELTGSEPRIIAAAWSPDAKRIVTSHTQDRDGVGGVPGVLRVWDAATGKKTAEASLASVCEIVTFDPTGKWIATWGVVAEDKRPKTPPGARPVIRHWFVTLYDPRTLKFIKALDCGEDFRGMAFSPDGSRLAVLLKSEASLWETSTGKLLRPLKGAEGDLYRIDYSADGKTIVAGGSDFKIYVWAADSGKLIQTFTRHPRNDGGITALRIRADGKTVLSACSDFFGREGVDHRAYLWQVGKENEAILLTGSKTGTTSIDLSKDEKILITHSIGDNVVRFRNPETGEETGSQDLGKLKARFVKISPDGKRFMSGGFEPTLRLWDIAGGAPVLRASEQLRSILAVRPDGGVYATVSAGRTVQLWEDAKKEAVRKLEGAGETIVSLAFSPDGKRIVAGLQDGSLAAWDAATGAAQPLSGKQEAPAAPLTFLGDGKRLAVANGKSVRLLDSATAAELRVLQGHENAVVSLAPYAGGSRLAVLAQGGAVSVWDLDRDAAKESLGVLHEGATSLSASEDGQAFAFGGAEAYFYSRNGRGGTSSLPLSGESVMTTPYAIFSPDGRWLVTARTDGKAVLWKRKDRKVLEVFHGASLITSIAFAGPGPKLLIGTQKGTVVPWSPKVKTGPEISHDDYVIESMASAGSWLATTNGSEVRLWDLSKLGTFIVLENSRDFRRVALRLENREVVGAGNTKSDGAVWSMDTGKRIRTFGARGRLPSLSADGKWLATQENRGWSAWSLEPGVETGKSPVISLVAISGNGTRVLTSETQKVRVFDVQGAKEIRAIDLENYGGDSAISPDGTKVALATTGRDVVLFDVSSGKQVKTLSPGKEEGDGLGRAIGFVSFSPDGKRLATQDGKGLLRIWSVNDGKMIFVKELEEGASRAFCWGAEGRMVYSASGRDVEMVEISK